MFWLWMRFEAYYLWAGADYEMRCPLQHHTRSHSWTNQGGFRRKRGSPPKGAPLAIESSGAPAPIGKTAKARVVRPFAIWNAANRGHGNPLFCRFHMWQHRPQAPFECGRPVETNLRTTQTACHPAAPTPCAHPSQARPAPYAESPIRRGEPPPLPSANILLLPKQSSHSPVPPASPAQAHPFGHPTLPSTASPFPNSNIARTLLDSVFQTAEIHPSDLGTEDVPKAILYQHPDPPQPTHGGLPDRTMLCRSKTCSSAPGSQPTPNRFAPFHESDTHSSDLPSDGFPVA